MMKWISTWWFWCGLGFLLYVNTLKHQYTIDDLIVVTSNKLTQQGVSAIPDIFSHSYMFGYNGREDESYRPLTLTTFAIEKSMFDANSSASHFIQVLLYALTVLVLFRYLVRLMGEDRLTLAALITLLFAVHPLHTEVVANVKSRDELMCALFLFLSLNLFARSIDTGNKRDVWISLFVFFLATLSKETAVMGVVLFPTTYYFKRHDGFMAMVKNSYLFSIPFLVYFLIRSAVLSDVLISDPIDPVANSLAMSSSFSEQLSTNFSIFTKYIQLILAPVSLSWDYSIAVFKPVSFGNPAALIGLALAIGLIAVTVVGLFKRSYFGFAGAIFISTFILTSNFLFLINCPLGERFMFIPLLGIIMMIVFLAERIPFLNGRNNVLLFSGIALVLGVRTIARNMDWKDNVSIYTAGVKECPNSVKTRFNLGTAYIQLGNASSSAQEKKSYYSSAVKELKAAQEIYAPYVNIYENLGFVYAELAKLSPTKKDSMAYFIKGKESLDYAIFKLNLSKPTLFQNQFAILDQLILLTEKPYDKDMLIDAMINTVRKIKKPSSEDLKREIHYLIQRKRTDEILVPAVVMAKKFPKDAAYLMLISEQFFKEGKLELSLDLMKAYCQGNPSDLNAQSNLGMLLEMLGKENEAMLLYEKILKADPNQAHTKELCEKLKVRMK
jgi:tetratricopeptide (TPR) repeat protein